LLPFDKLRVSGMAAKPLMLSLSKHESFEYEDIA
jgi:hypothetical protein